ncbi:sulfatase modifying factor 1 [Rhodococcus sp. 27YEA15]|uniref:formylglycine-generating enzyme family protein n=1 Tax=Rhodococcus sp. 27YEA15 TaxID=3156259 RepID=UPI003C7A0A7D
MTFHAAAGSGARSSGAKVPEMIDVPGGTFLMGSDLAEYPEEGPPTRVTVAGFRMDRTPVTVAEFRRFVRDTGYVTVAQRPLSRADYPNLAASARAAGSLVFTPSNRPVELTDITNWWRYVPGADWEHPEGPRSTVAGREQHPVTHVAWEDASVYAQWAGKSLATEAEWEWAARGGLDGALYAWGDELMPNGKVMANHWIGEFPWNNVKPARRQRTTPVGSYPENGYGFVDLIGNVWEWTSDFYRAQRPVGKSCCAPPENPRIDDPDGSYDEYEPGGAHIPRRVLKGGSHLCAENYCQRYRPAARQAQQVDSSMSHIGFRCVARPPSEGHSVPLLLTESQPVNPGPR